jgi:hypothetical protein
MGGAIGGVIGGIGSVFGGIAAGDAADAQGDALSAQMALAKAQWDRYMDKFAPYEDKMLEEAALPASESPGFLAERGRLNRSYGDLEREAKANLRTMYPAGGNMLQAKGEAIDRSRVKDIASLESDWNDKRWNKMLGIAGFGRGLPATAAAGYGNATSGYGNMANMYGNLAGTGGSGFGAAMANVPWSKMFGGFDSGTVYPSGMSGWGDYLNTGTYTPTGYSLD